MANAPKKIDITIPDFDGKNLKWSSDGEVQQSIMQLYLHAEQSASSAIEWYGRNKKGKSQMSQLLRLLAIGFTAIGGLVPLISAVNFFPKATGNSIPLSYSLGQVGYLLLGIAAACIGFDKFFGFSSGWMRYIGTKMTLEKMLSEFRMDWAMAVAKLGGQPPTRDQIQLMIQQLKEFMVKVNNEVEQETLTWVSEFRTNLAEIEKTAKAQSEASKPGAIDITVTNGMETDQGFTVLLDGMEVKTVTGTRYQIGYVPPGPHKISIKATVKGKALDASELVVVAAGEIMNVTLALPTQDAQP